MKIYSTKSYRDMVLIPGLLLLLAQYTSSPLATELTHYQSGDGISRWQFSSDGAVTQQWTQLQGLQTFTPVEQDGLVLVGSTSGLYALDSEHGEILWQRQKEKTVFTPVISDGVTYSASRDGLLHAYETVSGALLWQQRLSGWIYPPAISGEVLFSGGSDGVLWALSTTDGKLLWQHKLSQEMVYKAVVTADDAVLVTTFDGKVTALNGRDGRLLWQNQLTTPAFSPITDGERLFFTSYNGLIRALNIQNGELLWQVETDGDRTQQLLLASGHLLATLEQGLVLLAPDSGKRLRQQALPGVPLGKPSIHMGQIRLFYQQSGSIGLVQLNL